MAPKDRERGVFVPLDAIDSIELSDKQIVLNIPKSQMITVKVALESEIVRNCALELERCKVSVSESTLMAFFIFTESALGSRSLWKTYLDSLPQLGSGALFFGAKELDLLKATPLAKASEAKQRQLSKQYDCFANALHAWHSKQITDSMLSFERYKWAHFIVLSRAISLASFAATAYSESCAVHEGCDRVLLPVLDMFNHSSSNPSARWLVEHDGSVSVQICSRQAKRAPKINIDGVNYIELCFSYGEKPNTEWLYEYGFVPMDNAHGAWPYLIEPAGSSELVSVKLLWMQELGIAPRIMLQDPGLHGHLSSVSRETMLALCLEALDDTLDSCNADITGPVAIPKFPYFSINGKLLVDDDDKLLAVPRLTKHALDRCISRLEDARSTMLANIEASAAVNASVHNYLASESKLLSRIIAKLKNLIRAGASELYVM
ncbi:hypothetical protein J3B02_000905 [Coemansia erecta]|nr:hypothetical protein J3B02_000905 [Coemansia erecta]